jgi:UPF0716 protein FxsA
MLLLLFLLFTLMPLIELWLLVKLSGVFGFWATIAVVLLTGFAGAALARWQGWQAVHRIRSDMQQGALPTKAIGDGVMILVAGVLLITPGVITDAIGLALLLPPVRTALRKALRHWLAKKIRVETTFSSSGVSPADENVVEGRIVDAQVVDDPPR